MISLPSYLFLSFIMFIAGLVVMVARKNIIAILLGVELILNSAALNFAAYTRFINQNLEGNIMSLFIIVIAAAEAAVGLAIVIRFFQLKESVHIDDATQLQA
ncbi:MAG: NADH-quinone oxidoreductase subunit NuoK [Halobacteriovoraceae bacterium]|nr:NADH-quinone oxidoreductase subunit NuoK [Halobacteriovoraceae bacterium]MBC99731.1 NADH-quinone oxidoreductase subunit NuoK [Halobacteriovoraceae bacterium]|tara:strand:+ start:1777 stop:2082 length:306 start_codon:yes stop_codon:yes gene_type:complete